MKPDPGPIQDATKAFGSTSAMKPEPMTPAPMRGSRRMNSSTPSRAPSLSSTRPRRAATNAKAATTSHSRMLTASSHFLALTRASPARTAMRASSAGDDRQRHRLDDAPDHEVGAEERQFPHQRARIAAQRPRGDEGDHRAGVGAHGEKGAGHRIDGDRPARQQEAEKRRDSQAGETGFMPDPARHQFARQDHGDEGADQAAGQHLGQHLAEQREVAAEYGEEMLAPVAHIDGGGGGESHSGDGRGRPVEGAPAAAWRAWFGQDVAGGRGSSVRRRERRSMRSARLAADYR